MYMQWAGEGGGGGVLGGGGGHLVCNDWDHSRCMYRGLLGCPLLVKGEVWRRPNATLCDVTSRLVSDLPSHQAVATD